MGRWELGGPEGGRTLTSAPVSTRKLTPEVRSFTKKGDFWDGQLHSSPLVADWLVSRKGAGLAALACYVSEFSVVPAIW